MSKNIDIDLPGDFAALCRMELIGMGYNAAGFDDHKSVRLLLSVQRRLVSARNRQVLKSEELLYPPEYRQGLFEIVRKVRAGEDLTPHLSRNIRNPEYNDDLLNHWGIHHLHLGTHLESDGFVERTKSLLFVRFDDEHAYFIDVLSHRGSWTSQRLIKVLHETWPESIAQFKMPGATMAELSDSDVRELRRGTVLHTIGMDDGTVYLPPGWGTTTAGGSVLDMAQADGYLRWAGEEQRRVESDFMDIEARAEARGILFASPAKFELVVVGETFCAVETHSGYTLPLLSP